MLALEAKNVAKIFSTYFENGKLKQNETRELTIMRKQHETFYRSDLLLMQ